MPIEKIPLVSVIIPMYNAARFITQTLESLLYQTMKNFEVLIVDDCSTDNSVNIVEQAALPLIREGIKIQLIELPENVGMPGVVRNVGIDFAHGKYLAFLDSDDLFTKTALEELSTLAEEYNADVVNMTDFYSFEDNKLKSATTDDLLSMNHIIISCRKNNQPPLQSPVEISNNMAERVKLWLNNDIHWATCGLFFRRDFWIVNQISFPHMIYCEDQIVQFACLCLADKFLRVPNITYIVRRNYDSISRKVTSIEKYFCKWLGSLNIGFNEFNKVMNRFSFFDKYINYRYAVLNWFFVRVMQDAKHFPEAYSKIHPALLARFIEKEFHPDDAAFAAYLFNTVNIQRLQIMRLQQELAKFHQQ